MKSLAIIGTGIAGMSAAYALHRHYDLTVYERQDYAGGHTNTVQVEEMGRCVPIDTGFMVYNEVTYPLLTELFRELAVPTQPASMSFSVQIEGLEFCGSGWNGLFAQRKNIVRPRFWRLLKEIDRFNRHSLRLLEEPGAETLTLKAYADREGYSRDFLDCYLVPMSGAVWSTPPDLMLAFPAVTLIRFFKNHGFLGLNTQHAWRTVTGGSRVYRDRITAPFQEKLYLRRPAVRVARQNQGVSVSDAAGDTKTFDRVVIATHADEALTLLSNATEDECRLLGSFHYQRNKATLHTDSRVMPKTRRAWSSWNYRVSTRAGGRPEPSTVYWMNSLQGVSKNQDYFVSINDTASIDPGSVLKSIDYDHPLFSVEAIHAQRQLPRLNERGPIYFCGSYFRYGFHEDALTSGFSAAEALLPPGSPDRLSLSAKLARRAA